MRTRSNTGWLRLVGSMKIYVSFTEYCLFNRALLQKRSTIAETDVRKWHAKDVYERGTNSRYTKEQCQRDQILCFRTELWERDIRKRQKFTETYYTFGLQRQQYYTFLAASHTFPVVHTFSCMTHVFLYYRFFCMIFFLRLFLYYKFILRLQSCITHIFCDSNSGTRR